MLDKIPAKRISKSILSMYLRTKCDRELYFLMYKGEGIKKKGLPEPLKAKVEMNVLKNAGIEFEKECNNKLIKAFGKNTIMPEGMDSEKNKSIHAPLKSLLYKVDLKRLPFVILQGKIEVDEFKDKMLKRICPEEAGIIPHIDAIIPDVLIVRSPVEGEEEVCPDGSRKPVDIKSEKRAALSVIDIKHTGQANPSYRAEVSLYALFLSNWIDDNPDLKDKYFVTAKSYLWTNINQANSKLDGLISSKKKFSYNDYLNALIEDFEDANLRFYLSVVLRFFRESIPKVIKIGDEGKDGWKNLDWHVDSRCSSCDWLGIPESVDRKSKEILEKKPYDYCFTAAEKTNHLSRIAGLTRGARKTLVQSEITDVEVAAKACQDNKAFEKHSYLKKEKVRIPKRANALISDKLDMDDKAVLVNLARFPDLKVSVSVNFDSSAGLLTGLSLIGETFTKEQKFYNFEVKYFIVEQKNLEGEWKALKGFLSNFSDMITESCKKLGKNEFDGQIKAQVAFWERREFEELCNAIGRHLSDIMELENIKRNALLWLFPSDEQIKAPVSPNIVFVYDIVKRVLFIPSAHAVTLFDTIKFYHPEGKEPFTQKDSFYKEQFNNSIPRERIYEIWMGKDYINRGDKSVSLEELKNKFGNALKVQCIALNIIVNKLRQDFKDNLKSEPPILELNQVEPKNIARDSGLWIKWEKLQFQTDKLKSIERLALDSDTLEANFEAIRLKNGKPLGNNLYDFDVLESSLDAKLDDDEGFLTLGTDEFPGLPLMKGKDILNEGSSYYSSGLDFQIYRSLQVNIVNFDRKAKKITVEIKNYRDAYFFESLIENSDIDLLNNVFITKSVPFFNWSRTVEAILEKVGVPSVSINNNSENTKTSAETLPIAKILWDAGSVHEKSVISSERAKKISIFAKEKHNLNGSQQDAIKHASEKGLSVIWGPPGTGKTQTLAALVHGLVYDAVENNKPLKILLTGPTYKAVEEVLIRSANFLDKDDKCLPEIFMCYSNSAKNKDVSCNLKRLKIVSAISDYKNINSKTIECFNSLKNNEKVTIAAATTKQAYKFAGTDIIKEIFDVVIIDESSQVEVTTAISPLATLKKDFRLIVAGDNLQMPPISSLEPPKKEDYLVGSIQNYLIKRPFSNGSKMIIQCPLDINYRSAEDIVAYARTIGYRSTLKAFYPDTKLRLLSDIKNIKNLKNVFPKDLPLSELFSEIIDPDKKVMALIHEDEISSQSNDFEAGIVGSIVWSLRNFAASELDGRGKDDSKGGFKKPSEEEFWKKCVGIVTPHRAQRSAVIRKLKALFPNDSIDLIENAIDTVEKFQGGERQVIIITFGVGDADIIIGEEVFLMQLERINVAISRAMAKSIVIMPNTLADHVPQDKKAIETAHALKGYVDDFCNKEIIGEIKIPSDSSFIRKAKLRYRAKY